MNIGINNRTNFTAVKFPANKELYSHLEKEIADKFIEKTPEIEQLSEKIGVDYEIVASPTHLSLFAGKLLDTPWQSVDNNMAQYIHCGKPVPWSADTYQLLLLEQHRSIPDTIINKLKTIGIDYKNKLSKAGLE